MNQKIGDKSGWLIISLFILLAGLMITLWLNTPSMVLKWRMPLEDSPEISDVVDANLMARLGQFGDLFGSINALFSGLALVGVILAVVMQSRELSLQRQELEQTRAQIERTADANQKSAEVLKEQAMMQLRSAELMSINTLLTSVNAQLSETDPNVIRFFTEDSPQALIQSRKLYHQRIHEILSAMGHPTPTPEGCSSRE